MRRVEELITLAEEDDDLNREILLESEAPDLHGQSVVVLYTTHY